MTDTRSRRKRAEHRRADARRRRGDHRRTARLSELVRHLSRQSVEQVRHRYQINGRSFTGPAGRADFSGEMPGRSIEMHRAKRELVGRSVSGFAAVASPTITSPGCCCHSSTTRQTTRRWVVSSSRRRRWSTPTCIRLRRSSSRRTFLILVVLLRAIVAPLHLIVSVVISYLSALGVGVIAFQFIGGQQLSWSVSGMAFIVLVAVGADYNMLLISRVRDESPHSVTEGVIKTVATTGGVITSAGLIFAASMFGLLFGSIASMTQAGFIIGVGLLIDTFLVRTVTVPALAVLIGRANWWPTLWGRRAIRLGDVPSPQTEPFSMVDEICTALAGGESPHLIAQRLEVSLSSVAHIENVARSREESSENGPRIPAGK
jgi:hypothetical protein